MFPKVCPAPCGSGQTDFRGWFGAWLGSCARGPVAPMLAALSLTSLTTALIANGTVIPGIALVFLPASASLLSIADARLARTTPQPPREATGDPVPP